MQKMSIDLSKNCIDELFEITLWKRVGVEGFEYNGHLEGWGLLLLFLLLLDDLHELSEV